MGSILNFVIPSSDNFGKWCIQGPMTSIVMQDHSYTTYPNIKTNYKNYILLEPTEALMGLVKKIDVIFRKNNNLKKFIKENNLKIIIVSLADPPVHDYYKLLIDKLKFHDVFDDCIIITSNINLQGKNLYSYHFFIEQIVNLDHSLFGMMTDLGYKSEEIKLEELDNFRNKKFLSFNKTIDKPHRYSLLHDYIKYDFSDSYFSFLELEGIHCEPYQLRKLETHEYLKKIPIQLDTNNHFNFRTSNTMRKDLFLDSCINLVTETSYNQNELFISEKILKPILNYQPFIVLGPYNYIKELKRLGFKTFSDFWNESYDDILDGEQRYFKLSSLILKLNKLNIEQMNELYQSTKEICIYNKNHLKNLKLNSLDLIFKKLSDE
jgi:hypothetical protein